MSSGQGAGSSGLHSPKGSGLLYRAGSAVTPSQACCPRPRSGGGLRRTPQGFRGNCKSGFKSPVQSPNVSQSSTGNEDGLEREISDLKGKVASLDKEISQLEDDGYSLEELDEHISLLHEYNELKDTGQMLLGRLAVLRGVTTKDLYSEFGLELED